MLYETPTLKHLHYHKMQFKASHNTYSKAEKPEDIPHLIGFDPYSPHLNGCRGLEFDLHQAGTAAKPDWYVSHLPSLTGCWLREYLEALKTWSDANPNHDVITLTIDLKKQPSVYPSFAPVFDQYMDQYLGKEKMYTPADLFASAGPSAEVWSLYQVVRFLGWPPLQDLAGKFIVCLSGFKRRKAYYAKKDPRNRLCFADKTLNRNTRLPHDLDRNRVFYNFDLSNKTDRETWEKNGIMTWFENQPGLIRRGFGVNEPDRWTYARKNRFNLIATDMIQVQHATWASVDLQTPFGLYA